MARKFLAANMTLNLNFEFKLYLRLHLLLNHHKTFCRDPFHLTRRALQASASSLLPHQEEDHLQDQEQESLEQSRCRLPWYLYIYNYRWFISHLVVFLNFKWQSSKNVLMVKTHLMTICSTFPTASHPSSLSQEAMSPCNLWKKTRWTWGFKFLKKERWTRCSFWFFWTSRLWWGRHLLAGCEVKSILRLELSWENLIKDETLMW